MDIERLEDLIRRVRDAREPSPKLDADIYNLLCAKATADVGPFDYNHAFTHRLDITIELADALLSDWILEIQHGPDRHYAVANEFPPPCRRVPDERPYVVTHPTSTTLAVLGCVLEAIRKTVK